MTRSQDKQQGSVSSYSPIREQEQEGANFYNEEAATASPSGCGCFRVFFSGCCFENWAHNDDHETDILLQQRGADHKEAWLVKKLKKLKEVSELVAGPKWKNLVRKIGKYFHSKKSNKTTQFQYDPQSYALNFEQRELEDDDGLLLGFSSRFAPPVGSITDPPRKPGF